MTPDEKPYATVEQCSRWLYRVAVHDGISRWGPNGFWWTVRGRKRAMRKAKRVLADYNQRQVWKSSVVEVHQ
jgi:hypothetical protein